MAVASGSGVGSGPFDDPTPASPGGVDGAVLVRLGSRLGLSGTETAWVQAVARHATATIESGGLRMT
jgi:hypothetical protein